MYRAISSWPDASYFPLNAPARDHRGGTRNRERRRGGEGGREKGASRCDCLIARAINVLLTDRPSRRRQRYHLQPRRRMNSALSPVLSFPPSWIFDTLYKLTVYISRDRLLILTRRDNPSVLNASWTELSSFKRRRRLSRVRLVSLIYWREKWKNVSEEMSRRERERELYEKLERSEKVWSVPCQILDACSRVRLCDCSYNKQWGLTISWGGRKEIGSDQQRRNDEIAVW